MNTNVKQVVIQSVKDSLQQGDSLIFTAVVEGIFNPDQSVIWSLKGNTSKETTLSEKGLLTVGEKEKAESLEITATSVQDNTKVATVKVIVEKSSEVSDSVELIYTSLNKNTGEYENTWSLENSLLKECDKEEIISSLLQPVGQIESILITEESVDINHNEYYYDAVVMSLENGVIVEVEEDNFVPEDFRVNKENVTFLYRVLE